LFFWDLQPHGSRPISVAWGMGTIPNTVFESVRVRMTRQQIPVWQIRLLTVLLLVLGLVVFLLLLPLIVFVVVLFAIGIGVVRLRLWLSGVRSSGVPDDAGRENVRIVIREG